MRIIVIAALASLIALPAAASNESECNDAITSAVAGYATRSSKRWVAFTAPTKRGAPLR